MREDDEITARLRYLSLVVRVALVASVMSVLAGCGTKSSSSTVTGPAVVSARLPEGPPLLTPLETMSYRLALGGMDLATYDLAVGEVADVDGTPMIVVQSRAKTRGLAAVVTNVDDQFTSFVDVATGRPRRFTVEESSAEGNVRERTDAHFDRRAENMVPVDVWIGDVQKTESQRVTLVDVWDYNAFLMSLRSWEAPRGSTVTTEVFRSRLMWNVTMTIHGEEKLVTDLGEFPTLRIDGKAYRLTRGGERDTSAEERAFSIWITNDSGRVPVLTKARTDYGDIELSIVDYQAGTGQRLRP